uniref:MADF domain-containing protein n=1 Tax=Timema bartmani TaxID=61472 RepID=A0A7R9FDT5_9NEOP|nr:unnamed protein product [Timema bartmani]
MAVTRLPMGHALSPSILQRVSCEAIRAVEEVSPEPGRAEKNPRTAGTTRLNNQPGKILNGTNQTAHLPRIPHRHHDIIPGTDRHSTRESRHAVTTPTLSIRQGGPAHRRLLLLGWIQPKVAGVCLCQIIQKITSYGRETPKPAEMDDLRMAQTSAGGRDHDLLRLHLYITNKLRKTAWDTFWVPSETNPADHPSRQILAQLIQEEGPSAAIFDPRSAPTDLLSILIKALAAAASGCPSRDLPLKFRTRREYKSGGVAGLGTQSEGGERRSNNYVRVTRCTAPRWATTHLYESFHTFRSRQPAAGSSPDHTTTRPVTGYRLAGDRACVGVLIVMHSFTRAGHQSPDSIHGSKTCLFLFEVTPQYAMASDIEIDIEILISLVEARLVLWDKTAEIYKDKNATKQAWKEICIEFMSDFEELEDMDKNTFGMHSNRMTHQILKHTCLDYFAHCRNTKSVAVVQICKSTAIRQIPEQQN